RGAVPAVRARFPIPLSIRTCGFPAYGLPMIFLAWLRCPRIADRAAEPVQAVPVEPLLGPRLGLPGSQVATPLLDHHAAEPPAHVVVGLAELGGGVPGAEVVAPAAAGSGSRSHRGYPSLLRGCGRCGRGSSPGAVSSPEPRASGAGSSGRSASAPTASPTCGL